MLRACGGRGVLIPAHPRIGALPPGAQRLHQILEPFCSKSSIVCSFTCRMVFASTFEQASGSGNEVPKWNPNVT